jgi:hypothetical protein
MSQRDWLPAATEPEPPAEPSATRHNEMRSAAPGLCLFCANLLLGGVLIWGYLWPAAFSVSQPGRTAPNASPSATATLAVSANPANPAAAPTAQPALTASPIATTKTTPASATATRPVPSPTLTPAPTPTDTPAPPTPTPARTFTPGG